MVACWNDKLRSLWRSGILQAVVAGAKNVSDAGIIVGMTCVLTALNVRDVLVWLACGYLGNVEGYPSKPPRL